MGGNLVAVQQKPDGTMIGNQGQCGWLCDGGYWQYSRPPGATTEYYLPCSTMGIPQTPPIHPQEVYVASRSVDHRHRTGVLHEGRERDAHRRSVQGSPENRVLQRVSWRSFQGYQGRWDRYLGVFRLVVG